MTQNNDSILTVVLLPVSIQLLAQQYLIQCHIEATKLLKYNNISLYRMILYLKLLCFN